MDRRRSRRRKTYDRGNKQLFLAGICLCLLVGALLGAIGANTLDSGRYAQLTGYLGSFVNNDITQAVSSVSFQSTAIKYGKYVVLIWLCGWLAPGTVFIAAILLFRGMAYGFTSALLIRQYGSQGIKMALCACLPQNMLLVPVYIGIAYAAVIFLLDRYTIKPPKASLARERQRLATEYVILLAISLGVTAGAVSVEMYAVPFFIQNLSFFGG